jgi:L-ascorbate metabolism protein UlaG (beta-lactamase superfamily)
MIWILLVALMLPLVFMGGVLLWSPRVGANPKGERLKRIQAQPNYRDGVLHNVVPTDMNMPMSAMLKVMWMMLRGGDGREPKQPLPTVAFDRSAWERIAADQVALAWFGHSVLLIKLGGVTFLTDPVFGQRASMFSFAGPKRFRTTSPISADQLPQVDVVLLSHDHYDHLCYETITGLQASAAQKDVRYITALGVGAHVERWGVPRASITELEWWQQLECGPVKLTFAPARHFTGRAMTNRFSTLWGSFVLEGAGKRLYFGADSGYSPTFKELGERFGGFDLAMLECGAYSEFWPLIHMFPEETVKAAQDLRASVLMPIHWGTFALGLHPWKESIERATKEAAAVKLPLLTPRIGRIMIALDPSASENWWTGLR